MTDESWKGLDKIAIKKLSKKEADDESRRLKQSLWHAQNRAAGNRAPGSGAHTKFRNRLFLSIKRENNEP